VVPSDRIRNVIVLGHTGAGKSTLVEGMLRAAGVTSGPLEGCPTVDTDPEEQDRGHSLSLAVASLTFDGHTCNVLDTPGGVEALGDAYPAAAAADLAVLVVDATVGLQPQHLEFWDLCEQLDLPRLVFLNKLDLGRAHYPERLAQLRTTWGPSITAVQLPWEDHERLEGVIDIVHEIAIEEHDGIHRTTELPADRRADVDHDHEVLLESVVEHDDELLTRYLDGDVPTDAEVEGQLARDIADGTIVPVLCGAAAHDVGVEPLLRFLVAEGPAPRVPDDLDVPPGGTVACVVKTLTDPYVGRISVLRVLAGALAPDDELEVQRTGETIRAHQLVRLVGRDQTPVDGAATGDVVAVAKLGDVRTGDVLATAGTEALLEVPRPPSGFHRVVLEPATASDDAKLSAALDRVVQEDPSVVVTVDVESGSRVVSFLGPTHADVTLARLARAHGVTATVGPAPIAYRETIRGTASGVGRHVKQSGGHGQYGVVTIEISPRARGEGFSFSDETVGGSVPRQYVGAVERGVLEAMQEGPIGGHPVVDVGVRLLDGKHHSVDSSDAAFRMAGILAFRDAVAEAAPVLLEPVTAVTTRVPDDLTGAVLSDLASRRGRILGTTSAGDGWTFVEAHVPEAELRGFTADFRALTSGRGQVELVHDHHDEVPDAVARRLDHGTAEEAATG
jgi:elongation factor G